MKHLNRFFGVDGYFCFTLLLYYVDYHKNGFACCRLVSAFWAGLSFSNAPITRAFFAFSTSAGLRDYQE